MSAFNVVTVSAPCPKCSHVVPVRVQFKYGDTWQHEYNLGDTLRWGGNDIGRPTHERVVVAGVAEPCPKCGYDGDWDFYVYIERGVISSVEAATGRFDFVAHPDYIVLSTA